MDIAQIQVSYIDADDRLLMRLNVGKDKHVSLLLTRRVCRFMLENLSGFLKIDGLIGQVPSETAVPSIDDTSASHAEFQERPPWGNLLGAGAPAGLVSNASCTHALDNIEFIFQIMGRESINLRLSRILAQGVHHLLTDLCSRAQWFVTIAIVGQRVNEETIESLEVRSSSITYH